MALLLEDKYIEGWKLILNHLVHDIEMSTSHSLNIVVKFLEQLALRISSLIKERLIFLAKSESNEELKCDVMQAAICVVEILGTFRHTLVGKCKNILSYF